MTTVKLSEAKDRLSEIVKEVAETTLPVIITVRSHKDAVLISMDEYDSMRETIEILKNQNLVKRIYASMQEIKKGEVVPFEKIKKDI